MSSVNKVILIGHLGRDPETKYMPNGDAVTNIAVATTESWKDKSSGEKKEMTEWHRVTFYRQLAEIAGQYLKKGSSVYVEGKLQTRKWTDKDGVERYTTEIVADTLKMLGSPQGGRQSDDDYQAPPAQRQQQARGQQQNNRTQGRQQTQQRPPQRGQSQGQSFDDMDSDIPF